jgi:uncharacterized protein involved in tolerance to divalent cations
VTTPDPIAEWWTTSDVAEYLGIQIGAVSFYRNRNQMPEPDRIVGRTHLWRPTTIIAWNEERPGLGTGGRLTGDDRPGAFLQVSTALETRDAAEKLAREVVEAKLAAGAQIIGPVVSAFWHAGEFSTGEEWQLLLKTHGDRYEDLEAHLTENHPWKNPEVIAIPVVAGSEAYLSWVRKTVEMDEND